MSHRYIANLTLNDMPSLNAILVAVLGAAKVRSTAWATPDRRTARSEVRTTEEQGAFANQSVGLNFVV